MPDKPIVIVTGSSGLIGSAVVRRLAEQYTVAGYDRPGLPQPPEEAEAIDADLARDDSIQQAARTMRADFGPRIASVVHLAAYYDFTGEPSPMYEQVTVQGTRRLLQSLRDAGLQVEQFIFSSTMLIHAPVEPGQLITEDSPIIESWDYPNSKIRTERVIHDLRGETKAVFLRIAGVYDDTGHSIPLVQQMQRIQEEQLTSRVFPGNTAHGQSFVHLDDVVDAIARCIERRAQLPDEVAILIGEGRTLSYDELQHTFARLIHGEAESFETRKVPETLARVGAWVQDKLPGESFIKPWMIPHADDHYELDISRARQLLGWAPRHSLRGTLPKMVESLKRDPLAWYRRHQLEPPSGLRQSGEAKRP